jgi:hypothetical protein
MACALTDEAAPGDLQVADQVAPLDHGRGARIAGTLPVGRRPAIPPPDVSIEFTIAYEPVEDGWTQARIVELPPVITAARTRQEAKALVLDALREYLLSLQTEVVDGDGERESVALTISA